MADTEVLDHEYDPSAEPESSKAWLNLIEDAEKKFREYQDKCDRIDELYSDLGQLANWARDSQFQMFWANIQVLGPSVYSRPPVPVVVPKFQSREPLKSAASELLQRSLVSSFEMDDYDGTMRLIRDDMLLNGRGVPWVRYETKGEVKESHSTATGERVCYDFIDRKDFLHDPARNWREVGWGARRAWMTRKEMKKRFEKHSGDAYTKAAYNVQATNTDPSADPQQKAGVWEIWSKAQNKVVWVTEGAEELLDSGKPHLNLEGFYPFPRPAYTTLQRRTLIPVPDMLYYKDQLDEINKLTRRIMALSDAVRVKGFYPGGGEIGDAIEAALNVMDDRKIMVPVSNMAAFGGGGDSIIWMPIDQIATTIAGLIEMRRQIIEDVYQITGLSDIMRGATDPTETLGAQQLKSQYGSIRVQDKQFELVRIARDCARIAGEIMSENFDKQTLLDLSQLEIPTRADIKAQVKRIEDQVKQQAKQLEQQAQQPQMQQQAQQNPEAVQQIKQQAQQALRQAAEQIAELETQPTIEDVMELLRDQKLRPYAIDIETDSTIQPDEMAEKQARSEFLQAMGGVIQQLAPLVQTTPQASGFAGEILKFALAPYRAGRELEGEIDEFVEQMQQQGGQQQTDPAAEEAKAKMALEQQKMQFEMQKFEAESQVEQAKIQYDWQMKQQEQQADMQLKAAETEAKLTESRQKHTQDMEKGGLEIEGKRLDIELKKLDAAIKVQLAKEQAGQQADLDERSFERDTQAAEQKQGLAERDSKHKADLAERTAAQKETA